MITQKKCRFCHVTFAPAKGKGNAKTCGSKECLAKQAARIEASRHASQIRQKARKVDQPTYNSHRRQYVAVVHSFVRTTSVRGHAGTNYNPADQVEARKSALDWLLKGRKPESMHPTKVRLSARAKIWREPIKEATEKKSRVKEV